LPSGEVLKAYSTELGREMTGELRVVLDGAGLLAIKAARQPVLDTCRDRVGSGGVQASVKLAMERLEFVLDLSFGPAANLLPYACLAARGET
jgi:hypothetical protein